MLLQKLLVLAGLRAPKRDPRGYSLSFHTSTADGCGPAPIGSIGGIGMTFEEIGSAGCQDLVGWGVEAVALKWNNSCIMTLFSDENCTENATDFLEDEVCEDVVPVVIESFSYDCVA